MTYRPDKALKDDFEQPKPSIHSYLTERDAAFDEKFLSKDTLSSVGQFNEEVSGRLPALFKDFARETALTAYKLGIERGQKCVPDELPIRAHDHVLKGTYFYQATSHNNCRRQTLKNIDQALSELSTEV